MVLNSKDHPERHLPNPTFNPQELSGNWRSGWALDTHTISSRLMVGGVYDTVRTELGELVYQAKYHQDRSKIQLITGTAAEFIKESFKVDGYAVLPYIAAIIPIPPSDMDRSFQPVTEIAQELGRLLNLPVRTDLLTKIKKQILLRIFPVKRNANNFREPLLSIPKIIKASAYYYLMISTTLGQL